MSNRELWYQIGALLRRLFGWDSKPPTAAKRGARDSAQGGNWSSAPGQSSGRRTTDRPRRQHQSVPSGELADASPGQFGSGATRDASVAELKSARLDYAPERDGDPDPGEIVWTWVPYVENDGRGKDRPVLIIGRLGDGSVLGCYLSTKYHRDFISIGSGEWDSERRESFLSPERLLRITTSGMRREGAIVPREAFTRAVQGVLAYHRAG